MSHPGLNSTRLPEMRRALDEATMSDKEKRAVSRAVEKVEADLIMRHREVYDQSLTERDRQHKEVLDVTELLQQEVRDAAEDVRNGRRSADEVRKWLRDVHADFGRLTDQHHGVVASDDRLDEFAGMSPDDYQAEQFSRFPMVESQAPTIQTLVEGANPWWSAAK